MVNTVRSLGAKIWTIAPAFFVVLWRVAALRWPSTFVEIPDSLRVPLMLLGLLFLVCGLMAWRLRPSRFTGIFLLYGIGGGVHWGGAIGSDLKNLEMVLFFVYLALTALSDASLLHLALLFPNSQVSPRSWEKVLYFPAALALILAPIAGFVSQPTMKIIAMLVLLVGNLMSIIAGVSPPSLNPNRYSHYFLHQSV